MKKIIAAVLIAFVTMPAMAAKQFQDWVVNDDATLMFNRFTEDDGSMVMLGVYKNGNVSLSVASPDYKWAGKSEVVKTDSGTIRVNGTNVKFTINTMSDGLLIAKPTTEQGNTYVGNELWNKARVNFVFPTGERGWFSAKGVQQAWSYMKSNYAI